MAPPPPPKLPIPSRRNILVTSALPYVNNVPHLGNIIGCVLSADVFTWYCWLRGYNVIYICGTDEYGTATETKAMEENCSPKEICDKYHATHNEVYEWFDIKFDKFGRTSCPQQTEVCHAIFHKLMENNWLTENIMQQLYCDKCQRFLADRLVEGKCPTEGCNYDSARGDQCEKCSKLLNPTELIDPKCKVCKNTPRIRDTDHLFFELPLLRDKLVNYISNTSVDGMWSQNAIQATNAWLKEGLKPRCITRDLKWGVPVPHEKYKDKVKKVYAYIHKNGYKTKLMAAAVRNKQDVFSLLGIDYIIAPLKILQSLEESVTDPNVKYGYVLRLTPALGKMYNFTEEEVCPRMLDLELNSHT